MWMGLGLSALVAAVPAWSTGAVKGTNASEANLEQRISQQTAEVKRLQQDVAEQEAKNKQAEVRLQEQDKTIADLQRQLKELKSAPATDGTHP
jgi:septal ring factor EnvC (AmiA/AmiB activator)